MKHQYFGDINDYRKYGLLRILQSQTGLPLGVCWMLTPNDNRADGKFITYLGDPTRWRRRDPALFDALAEAVPLRRDVGCVRDRGILPEDTVLVDRTVPDHRVLRAEWFRQLQLDLGSSELVFFDPDNGLETQSCPPGRKDSSKYLTWDEVTETYQTGRSVLLYQHFPRLPRDEFSRKLATDLSMRTGSVQVICFRTKNVGFFLACQPQHETLFRKASVQVSTAWYGEFDATVYRFGEEMVTGDTTG